MKKNKQKIKVDWKSKFLDLLIVVIGITIAFKLNAWNETIETKSKVDDYIENFNSEIISNKESLDIAIAFSETNYKNIDSLKIILLTKNYTDSRILLLSSSMMAMANFTPSITTMENILASGDFDLIKDIELRKSIINTYNNYQTTANLEKLLTDYVSEYVSPFFFENIRFSDFSSIHPDYTKDPVFENIVFGYEVLLNQLINGYKINSEIQKDLNEKLNSIKAD